MGNDIIQAEYDELESIAGRFGKEAETTAALINRVRQNMQPLQNGGWQGHGSVAFFAEMNGELLPAVQRMMAALDQARTVTLQARDIIRQAEEEASRPFRSNGGSSGGFAKPDDTVPDVVSPEKGAFDGKRVAYMVGKPTEVKDYAFKSGMADALKYDVEVGGKMISVYLPKSPDGKAGHIHAIEEVAKGLAALPETSRKLVTGVQVNPGPNPKDPEWAKEYSRPGFRSYMTAGEKGVINIYPSKRNVSQDYLDGTMVHETGHTWAAQNWGNHKKDARWKDWKDAMTKDVNVASKYARSSPSEDFGETLQLYHQVKGTPKEVDFRKKMPERFKIIDDIVAGKR